MAVFLSIDSCETHFLTAQIIRIISRTVALLLQLKYPFHTLVCLGFPLIPVAWVVLNDVTRVFFKARL